MRGPIDYLIVGFETSKFDGSILDALADAVENGTIAILDLAVVVKSETGEVTQLAMSELDDDTMSVFLSKYTPDQNSQANLDESDIQETAELMENNTAAGILVIEHLWAKPLKKALLDKKAYLIAEGRIHADAAAELDKGE